MLFNGAEGFAMIQDWTAVTNNDRKYVGEIGKQP